MNANAKKWIEALRSGKYSQCAGRLRRDEPETGKTCFCVMGVGCEIAANEGAISRELKFGDYRYADAVAVPPLEIETWLGLTTRGVNDMLTLNDDKQMSFPEIADWLEAHPEVFVDYVNPEPIEFGC